MNSILLKASVPSAVALLVTGLMFPYPAFAVGRDVGNLIVDCGTGNLEEQTIVYLEIGDTFTIENVGTAGACLIDDPSNILTDEGEILSVGNVSSPVTIDGSGTFTISETGGSAGAATAAFRVSPGILFAGDEKGENAQLDDDIDYSEVFLLEGTTVVDATVTVTDEENQNNNEFELDTSRKNASGGIGTRIGSDSDVDSFVEYTVSFHAPGNPDSPITLSNISVTINEIDELKFITSENVDSSTLSGSPATNLSTRTVGSTLFVEELTNTASSYDDPRNRVVLNFDSASSITIGLGFKVETNNGDGDASFDAVFTTAEPEVPAGPAAPAATTTPKLATTGANLEWLMVAGFIAAIAGASFLTVSRRKRTA